MARYSKMLSSAEPGCIVLLIDQSASMSDAFGGVPGSHKHIECAKAVNRVIQEIAIVCRAGKEIKNRCFLGLIGYGDRVGSAFQGGLAGKELVGIADVAQFPIRIEDVKQKVSDGAGGLADMDVKFPIWLEPVALNGTPMAAAFRLAAQWLASWVQSHPTGFPPIVINITDGEPNESAPFAATKSAAEALRGITTDDGELLLLNAHLSSQRMQTINLPDTIAGLPDQYAEFLFDISSMLPDMMQIKAQEVGFHTSPASRGFVFNADAQTLIRLLAFGSNPGLR